MLRILDGCLYSPALFTVGSIRSEYNRLLSAVFVLTTSAPNLGDGKAHADKETASQEALVLFVPVQHFWGGLRRREQGLCLDEGPLHMCHRPQPSGHLESDLGRSVLPWLPPSSLADSQASSRKLCCRGHTSCGQQTYWCVWFP